MPNLLIMRHAKSDWSENLPDFDRPLNPRGLGDAEKMGAWLKQHDRVPDRIVSSPARRAEQTTRIVCEQLGKDEKEIIRDERIYEASPGDLLEVIGDYINTSRCLLLTGHNPGLDYLVKYLSAELPSYSATGKLMTTAAIAAFEFKQEFDGKPGSGQIAVLVRPKEV